MYARAAAPTLHRLAEGFPVVVITGPRQSGKSTLARRTFPQLPYVSLEDFDQQQKFKKDPRSFLAFFKEGAIFDEAQRVPELFSYLQTQVDENLFSNHSKRQFIITGSQNLAVSATVSQSLAGRAGQINLLPLSLWEFRNNHLAFGLDEYLYQGSYPALFYRHLRPVDWFPAYITNHLERDIRQLSQIHNLQLFQRFLQLCAGRVGQLLNLANLATETGISQMTARHWLTILEATYIVFLLPPYHRNFNKRVVKTPKLYFYDTGLVSHLLNITNPQQLALHPYRGALFENWIVIDILKNRFNAGLRSNLFFWRDNHGTEIDLLLETGNGLQPIEIKSGQTIYPEAWNGINRWMQYAGANALHPWLVYGGEQSSEWKNGYLVSWRDIAYSPVEN